MPPLKHFTHSFLESRGPEPELTAQADVIVAVLEHLEDDLEKLTAGMKEDAQIILLASREQSASLPEDLSKVQDIWPAPMSEREVRFRFQHWQQDLTMAKDLWQTGQFLNAALDCSPNLIWYKDREGVYKRVNESFSKAAGKAKEEIEEHRYAYAWNVEEDDPGCVGTEAQIIESGKCQVSNESIKTGKGTRLLKTYRCPLYDLDGSVMGTVGVGMDVTRERGFEREALEKGKTLEMLFATMDCGVMCHTLDGKRVISINQAALRLLGYEFQREMMEDGFDLVAASVLEEDKPRLRSAITSLKDLGDSIGVEYRVQHKDGSILYILGNVKLIKQNGELLYQRFLLDFTVQKLQEEARLAQRDREMQYQERVFEIFSTFLADNVNDIYIMLNETGDKIEFITRNVERVLGIPADSLDGGLDQLGWAEYLTGEPVSLDTLRAMAPGDSLEKIETERINRATGEHRWFREGIYCVSVQDRKKIVVYISDRTTERKTQDTLTEALEMAQVANKAKSTFLSSVSHDIRTPMNAIMGLITLLQEEANDPERVLEYTQKISAASQHLLGLINDVLDMNKIESGSAVLNISDLSLAEVVDELNTIIRPQAKAKDQTFEIYVSHLTSEHLLGDKLRINQIMINILSNAIKYTHPGGRIEMRVNELPQVDKNYIRIQFIISDNGQGMSKEYQKVIFDPFTREQELAWNQIQGTGLGMAITKSLVDLMGGTIGVESQMGKGSTFTVELELRIQEKEEDPEFWTRHNITRMIVADDDEEICKDIVKKMSGTGVSVQYVTRGALVIETIRAARERGEPYDLILLDWKMPELDGLETARLIRKNYSKKIPILLFTAYEWSEIEEEALNVGIEHFMPKPFFMSNFKGSIQRMMGTRKKASISDGEGNVVAGRRVLVVDDIEVNRMILTKILATLGAVCETAENGQEAVDRFEESQTGEYDLILMDIQMPILNGYEATQAIRASDHPSAQSVAIIAMTANAFVDDIRDAIEAGMDAHVSKPIVLDQLKRTIQEVFERKGLLDD